MIDLGQEASVKSVCWQRNSWNNAISNNGTNKCPDSTQFSLHINNVNPLWVLIKTSSIVVWMKCASRPHKTFLWSHMVPALRAFLIRLVCFLSKEVLPPWGDSHYGEEGYGENQRRPALWTGVTYSVPRWELNPEFLTASVVTTTLQDGPSLKTF